MDKSEKAKTYKSLIRKNNTQVIAQIGEIEKTLCKKFEFILSGVSKEEIKIGIKLNSIGKFLHDFVINQRGGMFQKAVQEKKAFYKVLGGKQINRYSIAKEMKGYINKNAVQDSKAFIKPNSILVQNIVAHIMNPIDHIQIIATISDDNQSVILDTINQLENKSEYSNRYLIALLNSKLSNWFVYRFIFAKAIRTMHFDSPVTSRIPIPLLDLTNKTQKAQHDKLVSLVDTMLTSQKDLHAAISDSDKKVFQQKCDLLDAQIDKLVYELYGLTEEEIRIVEGG